MIKMQAFERKYNRVFGNRVLDKMSIILGIAERLADRKCSRSRAYMWSRDKSRVELVED